MQLSEVTERNYMRAEVTWIKHVSCGNNEVLPSAFKQ